MDSPFVERRRYPRIRLMKPLHDQTVALRAPFALHDVSLGGFCIEAPLEFPAGATHEFGFTVSEGPLVILTGVVKHCIRVNRPDGETTYLIGFEFVVTKATDPKAIDAVVRTAMTAEQTAADAFV
jgi:hypothetical protein